MNAHDLGFSQQEERQTSHDRVEENPKVDTVEYSVSKERKKNDTKGQLEEERMGPDKVPHKWGIFGIKSGANWWSWYLV